MKKRVLIPPGPPRRGAPPGNNNAYKHGKYTRERRALYADIRAYIASGRALIDEFKSAEPEECSHAEPRKDASQGTRASPSNKENATLHQRVGMN